MATHAIMEQDLQPLAVRPSPEAIDGVAARYNEAKTAQLAAAEAFKAIEDEAIALVDAWGQVPPHAEKSRRLTGAVAELTITRSDTLSINAERVEILRAALVANGFGAYFSRLFARQVKYEVVEGAESALKSESLPKRLAEKVLQMWGRCITVKPKKPSLRVTMAQPTPAKRQRKERKQS